MTSVAAKHTLFYSVLLIRIEATEARFSIIHRYQFTPQTILRMCVRPAKYHTFCRTGQAYGTSIVSVLAPTKSQESKLYPYSETNLEMNSIFRDFGSVTDDSILRSPVWG